MKSKLFNAFDSINSKQWKQLIQTDLKGADYNDTLIWKTNNDIHVKPFYNEEDRNALPQVSIPSNTWKIQQTIYVADLEKSNKTAVNAIKEGVESISFIIPEASISFEKLLNNIDTSKISIHIYTTFISEEFIQTIPKNIIVHTDIIGNLAKTGNWYTNLNDDHKQFDNIVKQTKTISVNTALYQNAGANIVQQLAYSLAHVNEYFNHLESNTELKLPQLEIHFNIAIGTNYFFEIAKIRALKLLFKSLASEYNIKTDCIINATPTRRNKTIYDYNTNMLRTTTECMSAILGGAHTINNLAYDSIYHKTNAFGERIAKNQLLVLKHESYFDAVTNASDGSYYIESLTHQLAEKALKLFKDIESNGGFLEQLKSGIIQKKIKESASKEQEQFNNKSLILLGTNKHPNSEDKMSDDLELYPFIKTKNVKTLIEPIIEKRLAEKHEQERLKTEHKLN